jgi:hypothetical protein
MKESKMNIEKALNRINWRFKNPQVKINESKIIINQTDIDAIYFLTNWIEQQKKETKQENLLFAKVFCYAFKNEIVFYNGSAKFAQSKLVDILKTPLEHHYDNVHEVLNNFDLWNYSKEIGLSQKHPALKTNEEEKIDFKILESKDPVLLKKILGNWTKESVYKSLNNTITEAINRFKNTH